MSLCCCMWEGAILDFYNISFLKIYWCWVKMSLHTDFLSWLFETAFVSFNPYQAVKHSDNKTSCRSSSRLPIYYDGGGVGGRGGEFFTFLSCLMLANLPMAVYR
jgi:hypothetical protein